MRYILLSISLLCAFSFQAQSLRKEFLLEKNWKFSRTDDANAVKPAFDDASWQSVTVPHDWAISGPFDGNADVQNVAIIQDGETEASLKSGRTGGLPFIGIGWYRLKFDAPDFDSGKHADIIFDGAMSNARVYLNGKEVGYWPYGYNSFHFDITPYLKSKDNVLAVRLENFPESSRWYPGAGLYRNVHVVITEKTHVPVWGTYITTPVVKAEYAKVKLKTKVDYAGKLPDNLRITTEIKDPRGIAVCRTESGVLTEYDDNAFEQNLTIIEPKLWSVESPTLYTAISTLYVNGKAVDEYSTRFGVRQLDIIPDKGMFLNGKPIKFQGVCNHHDLGPLGAAINVSALRRQLTILKDMGCNAIRTSHNMPAPELVRLCDEMGFMMMVEAFDEWQFAKCKNGYNRYFNEWAEKDMVNMLHQFRNNPSVVMWSIGNEVPGQASPAGVKTGRFLQDICHREDPTRKVTFGIDQGENAIKNHFASMIDVIGFNYRLPFYLPAYNTLAQSIVLGSETASTLSARGVYKFPVVRKNNAHYPDGQMSSYDVEHPWWSNLPEDDAVFHDDYPWCIGEFVWTGFDYLGEPTPYSNWPNHSSHFGIIDLAGIPKDRFYLYRSHWKPEEETLHILPHWNWKGREGEITPIFVYTNYPTAELFINGKSQGKRTKDESVTEANSNTEEAQKSFSRQKRYRLMWMDVKYEPGTVKVVAYDKTGKAVAEREIHTAGKPHHLVLKADRTQLSPDGKDLAFITVSAVDKDGNLCPDAADLVSFSVKGAGSYRAAANGDATCLDIFHKPQMHLFGGQLVAIVQSGENAGKISFEAKTAGVSSGKLELTVE
jgi:beta-galactosidase